MISLEDKKASNSEYSIQEIHKILKQKGSRLTPQREYILDVFFKSAKGFHLSVEDIHKALLKRPNATSVSLATVYRTVKVLYLMGILREVDLAEGHKHYELASSQDHHHHIVCLNCNKTIEFFNEEVNKLAREIAKAHDVEVQDVELKIFGKCIHLHDEAGQHHEHRR